jgi:hypothetical protein
VVLPGRRGTVLRAAAIRTVSREAKIDAERLLRDDLDPWLAALAAISEDRQPWPAEGIPPALREACLARRFTGSMAEASASVDVAAPADKVGRAVASLDVLRTAQPEGLCACGYVPGTPVGEVGGLRYFVFRRGEKLPAVTSLLAAASPTAVMARQITSPHAETTFSWAAAADGTRLDVRLRVPGSEAAMSDERRQAIEARVTRRATRYKAAIESWPG